MLQSHLAVSLDIKKASRSNSFAPETEFLVSIVPEMKFSLLPNKPHKDTTKTRIQSCLFSEFYCKTSEHHL